MRSHPKTTTAMVTANSQRSINKIPLFCLAALLIFQQAAAQSVPSLINYQGQLLDTTGKPLPTADYELIFRIYSEAQVGLPVWGPQVFDGANGQGHGPKIPVVQGYFNAMLGPVDTAGRSIADAFSGPSRWVEVTVGTNPPILPRQQILSSPYAFSAGRADMATTAAIAIIAADAPSLLVRAPLDLYVDAVSGADANDGLAVNRAKKTIQAAVDAIPPIIRNNVTIHIAQGIYREMVRIEGMRPQGNNHWIHLEGAGVDAVRVTGSNAGADTTPVRDSGFLIYYSDHISLANMRIDYAWEAFEIIGALSVKMDNIIVEHHTRGMTIAGFSSVSIRSCIVQNNANEGVFVNGHSYAGWTGGSVSNNGSIGIRVDNCSSISDDGPYVSIGGNGSYGVSIKTQSAAMNNGNFQASNNNSGGAQWEYVDEGRN